MTHLKENMYCINKLVVKEIELMHVATHCINKNQRVFCMLDESQKQINLHAIIRDIQALATCWGESGGSCWEVAQRVGD